MKEYNYYLFDFDGTLMNSFEAIYKIFTYVYNKIGITINKGDVVHLARIPVAETYSYLVKEDTKEKEDIVKQAFNEIIKDESVHDNSSLFDEVKDVINILVKKNKKLGIITNNDSNVVKRQLNKYGLNPDYFIIIGNDETNKKKPDKEPIEQALKRLSYQGDRKDICMIGDSLIDMECALNAGVDSYLVERFDEYKNYKGKKIKSLEELIINMDLHNELKNEFITNFNNEPSDYIRCGGRFEVLGNHTDHNHGLCVAATVNMSIYSAVKKREDKIVEVISKGYDKFSVDLSKLSKVKSEVGTSASLIRGIANYLKKNKYNIGGFSIYMESTIFKGAGVSSSAAFEMLIGKVFSSLFNEDKISTIELAKAGQYAENEYYGKSCGLLDQIGVSFGNMVSIDFNDINDIKVNNISVDLKDHTFYLVNTGGDHSSMSDLYTQIPLDMLSAAKKLGVNYLRETTLDKLEENKDKLTEIEYSRALHFFMENERVKKFIKKKDVETLISCINLTRLSCTKDLRNMVAYNYEGSPLEACDLVMKLTNQEGACKINGGGFAGSIVCLIPNKYEESFIKTMKDKYGDNNVYKAEIDVDGFGHF